MMARLRSQMVSPPCDCGFGLVHQLSKPLGTTLAPAPSDPATKSPVSESASDNDVEFASSDDESSSEASVNDDMSTNTMDDEDYVRSTLAELGRPLSELDKDIGRVAIMQATTGSRIKYASPEAIAYICLRSDKNHVWHSSTSCVFETAFDEFLETIDDPNALETTAIGPGFGTTVALKLLGDMYNAEIDHDVLERRGRQLTQLAVQGWLSEDFDVGFLSSARHGEAIQKMSLLDTIEFSPTADIAGSGFLLKRKSVAKRAAKIVTCDQISQEFGGPRVPVISADNGHSQVVVQWTEIGDYQDALMPKPLINVLYLAIDMVYDVVVTLASGKSSRLRNLRTSVDIALEDLPEVISYIEQELKRASWSELNEHAFALHIIDAESCLILEIRAATTICSFLAKVLSNLMDPTSAEGWSESKGVAAAFQLLKMRAQTMPLNPFVIRLGLLAIRLISATVMRGHAHHGRCLLRLSIEEARTFFKAQLQ